jgi:MFS family permease
MCTCTKHKLSQRLPITPCHRRNQYQSIYFAALGATAFQLGVANSIGGLSAVAVALPIGLLADRYSVRRMFPAATALMLFAAFLLASAENWIIAIAALLVGNLGLQMETHINVHAAIFEES